MVISPYTRLTRVVLEGQIFCDSYMIISYVHGTLVENQAFVPSPKSHLYQAGRKGPGTPPHEPQLYPGVSSPRINVPHLYRGVSQLGINVPSLDLYRVGIRPGTNVIPSIPRGWLWKFLPTPPFASPALIWFPTTPRSLSILISFSFILYLLPSSFFSSLLTHLSLSHTHTHTHRRQRPASAAWPGAARPGQHVVA
jgi:hypothetical protein